MKSFFLLGSLLMAAPAFGPLFPPAEVLDRTSLDLKISEPSDYSPVSAPERKLKRIDLTFTSFEWAGEKWRHPAMILLPDRVAPEYRGAGVVIAGNGSRPDGAPFRYAEAAALMGIPALAITGANPGPHYGAKNEGAVMSLMQKKFLETGDPHWIGYTALSRVIVRAVTAMQAVPGVQADRFVITGGSKRAMASWVAAAADDRIVGAYPGAWNFANFEASLRLQVERYGPDYKKGGEGPASESPGRRLATLSTPRSKEYQRFLDPWLWRDRIANKKILFSAGANDPLFPPLSDTVFLPGMPKSTRILLIPNQGHGHDSGARIRGMAHVAGARLREPPGSGNCARLETGEGHDPTLCSRDIRQSDPDSDGVERDSGARRVSGMPLDSDAAGRGQWRPIEPQWPRRPAASPHSSSRSKTSIRARDAE